MNRQLNGLEQQQQAAYGQLQQQQAQNCIYPYWEQWRQYQPQVQYIYQTVSTSADVTVNRVENGFSVTIKGKKYVAKESAEIAALIEEHLK